MRLKQLSAVLTAFLILTTGLYARSDLETVLIGKWKWKPYTSFLWLKPDGTVGNESGNWAKWRITDASKNKFEITHFAGRLKGRTEVLEYYSFNSIRTVEGKHHRAWKVPEEHVRTHSSSIPRFFTGYWMPKHPNGKIARKVPVINGKKDGTGIWYYPSGNVQYETSWQAGVAHGVETEYYDTARKTKKRRTVYKHGKKQGFEMFYDESGRLTSRIEYKDGQKVQ